MIVNFFLFQIGWFASVLGASRQSPWLGVLGVVAVVAVHLAVRGTPRELSVIGAAAVLGLVMDTLLLQSGLVTYRAQSPVAWLAPVWIVAMWANLAITLRHSLGWLDRRYRLAALAGGVFGPLAYWGASGLGAVALSPPVPALGAVALVWSVSLPALFLVSGWLR